MRKLLALLVLAAFAACADDASVTSPEPDARSAAVTPAQAGDAYAPGRVLAKMRPGANAAAVARAHGAALDRDLAFGIRLLSVPDGRELAVAAALSRSPNVEFAEPDWIRTFGDLEAPTDDVFFGYKWDLHNDGTVNGGDGTVLATTAKVDADIDWLEAFNTLGQFTGGARLGILDTGIRATHEDLAGRVVAQRDFHAGDADASDDNGHGTHVAGIATAFANNGKGVAGVAYGSNVKLVIAKVCGPIHPPIFGQNYGCYESSIVDGIGWAVQNGAHVLNLSLGGSNPSTAERTALANARAAGVLPVCAAGNDGGAVSYPGAFPECVAVSATDWGDDLASYSNFGSQVELSAPGGDTESASGYSYIASSVNDADDAYALMAGTSMASPQVAGLATLLHALGYTGADAKLNQMVATVDDLGASGRDNRFGHGRINVFRAIGGTPPDDGGTTNSPPTASFTHSCTDLACDFDGTGSSDSDGTIASWAWDFGDGSSGSGATTSHDYAAGGTYTVTLVVTDDAGDSDTTSRSVTVSEPSTGGISLSVSAYKVKGVQHVDLSWAGANSTNVDVYRDGAIVTTTANDGAHTDNIGQKGGGVSYVYQVCEAGTTTCSGQRTATF